jgi:hypothetical protein
MAAERSWRGVLRRRFLRVGWFIEKPQSRVPEPEQFLDD